MIVTITVIIIMMTIMMMTITMMMLTLILRQIAAVEFLVHSERMHNIMSTTGYRSSSRM